MQFSDLAFISPERLIFGIESVSCSSLRLSRSILFCGFMQMTLLWGLDAILDSSIEDFAATVGCEIEIDSRVTGFTKVRL